MLNPDKPLPDADAAGAPPGEGDTIAAIATPHGRGGVGVVRVSGRGLAGFATALLGALPRARYATRGAFLDAKGRAIDDGLALYFPAPGSYTGEDVLELHGHGGPVVMQMLLRRCVELGARLAEPGEFTRRAFLNDKLDLAQAEGVADLIEAASEAAARCALRSLRGEFSAVIEGMAGELVDLRMRVEATLDFPEEELEPLDRVQAAAGLARLRGEMARAIAQGREGSVLRTGLQVVLAGQPNVGKSSLLNRLAGEERAIVTALPGTTRDALRETIQLGGVPINVIDTAGLRDTSDEIEMIGISRAWKAIGESDVLLLVVESARGIAEPDREILGRLPASLQRVVVFNKIDLSGESARAEKESGITRIWLSAKTGEGTELLRHALLAIAGWHAAGEDVFMARERHLGALQRAAQCLERAESVLGQTELFAEELRLAQRELGAITGEFTTEDLLGEIFSRFCIGK